jgi:hypothetical protein
MTLLPLVKFYLFFVSIPHRQGHRMGGCLMTKVKAGMSGVGRAGRMKGKPPLAFTAGMQPRLRTTRMRSA